MKLTAREQEVLRLLARGLTNKAIAAVLTIAPRTVGTHIEHIYMKIGVSSRVSASMFALRHGLGGEVHLARLSRQPTCAGARPCTSSVTRAHATMRDSA